MTPWHNNPNSLEDALREALRRQDAPEQFTASVVSRVAQNSTALKAEKTSWRSILARPLVQWPAIAAVSVCLIFGGVRYRNLQRERAEGETAKQQLMLALRIAGSKLQLAKSKVNEINTSPKTHSQNRNPRSRS